MLMGGGVGGEGKWTVATYTHLSMSLCILLIQYYRRQCAVTS